MLRRYEECTVFRNGNLNIRLPRSEIPEFKKDPVLYLVDLLSWLDCDFIGETYCLSNFETGHTVYNAYMDCVYIFPWRVLEDLENGKTVKLYTHELDETDRELLEKE